MFFFNGFLPTNFIWTVLHRYLELGAEIETGNKWDLKCLVPEKKISRKHFGRKKKMVEKNFGRKKNWSNFFRSKKKCGSKKIDRKKSTEFFSVDFFSTEIFKIKFLHEKLFFLVGFFFSRSIWMRRFDSCRLLQCPIQFMKNTQKNIISGKFAGNPGTCSFRILCNVHKLPVPIRTIQTS